MKDQSSILRLKQALKKPQKTPLKRRNLNPKKGRRSNKTLREQEAVREKVAGKQSNLDFLVKNSQASNYLLSADEGKKEREKVLRQLKK